MIGEAPEWTLWAMVGLIIFIMLLPLLKALVVPPPPRAGGGHIDLAVRAFLIRPAAPASRVPSFLRRMAARDWAQPDGLNRRTTQ
jgi:hypothetical protein